MRNILFLVLILAFTFAACSCSSIHKPENGQENPAQSQENPTDSQEGTAESEEDPASSQGEPGEEKPSNVESQSSDCDAPAAEQEVQRVLVFSEEEKAAGYDKRIGYTKNDLQLLNEAVKLASAGKFADAEKLYEDVANRTAAWQRDPLLLVNWGSAQVETGKLLDAFGKFMFATENIKTAETAGAAVYKANMTVDADAAAEIIESLKNKLAVLLEDLAVKFPASEAYDDYRMEILKMLYELDSKNPTAALNYVISALYSGRIGVNTAYNILLDVDKNKGSELAANDRIVDAWLKLASVCLERWHEGAYEVGFENIFKRSVARASEAAGPKSENAFLYFLKAIQYSYEGMEDDALRFMSTAESLAPENRVIGFWLAAHGGQEEDRHLIKEISLDDFGFKEGYFDTYMGTMWLDNQRILLTVSKPSENYMSSSDLLVVDVDTLKSRKIYTGEILNLMFTSPGGKFVVLYDSGSSGSKLVAVNIETGEAVKISSSGYQCALSPDGSKVAYAGEGIWVYDFNTRTKVKVSSGRDDASPIWFPDGESLLFIGDLGGRELGDGAGHLQGIFKMTLDYTGGSVSTKKKERMFPEWQGKYHYLEWIKDGEIVHAAYGWDDGFASYILDLKKERKAAAGSLDEGCYELFFSRTGSRLYMPNTSGSIKVMDLYGKTLKNLEFGSAWGYKLGTRIRNIGVLPNGKLLVASELPLESCAGLWLTDKELGSPVFLAWNEDKYGPQNAIVNPQGTAALVCVGSDSNTLRLLDIKQ